LGDHRTLGRGWWTPVIQVTARNVVKIKALLFGTPIPASPRHEEKWEKASIYYLKPLLIPMDFVNLFTTPGTLLNIVLVIM
jgi:hypothetical protein